jgi:hypothetical protein
VMAGTLGAPAVPMATNCVSNATTIPENGLISQQNLR